MYPLALAAACYVLAFVQRPGLVFADTKVDLYVDPHGFLGDVASAWSPTIGLGHVFGGQYGGYLFPMAPWFALGDTLGVPTWIVHRLWLGTVLAVAAWGVVRLLDALVARPRGAPHVAAAVLFVLNPYVAVYANRTSITLLAYAALPWLLLAVHRGLREPRGWRWPALFALVLTCTGGGVNVAVTGWVLVGPLLLLLYERFYGGVARGAIVPFLVRLVPVVLAANLWWLVPVLVHQSYGLNFLPFTEQPGTIWQTTSITESLRLMGFWTSYIGLGFTGPLRPYSSEGHALLFHPPVVVASLLVPAFVLGGFAWTRRWRYGPFFLLLALASLLIMVTGFPEGTPLRRALTFTYNHVQAVQFLRTTYKAGPLLALGLACLGGAAFAVAWDRLGRWVAVPLALVAALAAWPLTTGRAPEPQLKVDVPAYWHQAARAVDRLPAGQRAMVLPGRLFAYYDWGGTIDPVLPALARRPVAERMIVPFADLRADDLQFSTDALISQERALPGQLSPLLDLMGVGAVVTPADDDRARSGAVGVVEADDAISRDPALARSPRSLGLGPVRVERPAAGHVRAGALLPRVTLRPAATGGMVRVLPRDDETVLDGGGEGVTALAGFGALDPDAPLRYAADVAPARIRRAASVVITDTNRRQAFVAARLQANRGRVLAADESLSQDGAMLDPFARDADAQTVARLRGVRSLWSPFSPQTTQFPEHRPFAALDGDLGTAWLADRALDTGRHWLEVRFGAPRRIGAIDVVPYDDSRAVVEALEVNGRRVAVHAGVNRIRVGATTDALRIRIAQVRQPAGVTGGAGGIRELRIPGVHVREALRPPVLAERALAGTRFAGRLTYLFSRFTADAPYRTADARGDFQTALLRDRQDPERRIVRDIDPPVRRAWVFDAWVTPGPTTSDAMLDRLAGTLGSARATSTARLGNQARFRASRALDGDRRTAWVAPWQAGERPALTVALRRPATIRRLRLAAPTETVRRPTRVAVNGVAADVGPDGTLVLARALRGARFTLRVLAARYPAGTPARIRQRRAVGIGELQGLPRAATRALRVRTATGRVHGRCGDASVRAGSVAVALRVVGDARALEEGLPLRAVSCGPAVALARGPLQIAGGDGPLRVDDLRMRGLIGTGAATLGVRQAPSAGDVLDAGRDDQRGARDDVRVQVTRPGWLVLGEGYNRGWRATCGGRDLGAPQPMQGFANAWPVQPGCTDVAFSWAPNRLIPYGYAISLLACLALIVLLARRRLRVPAAPSERLPDDAPAVPWPGRRALAAGVVAAVVLGFAFALRAGVVLGPLVGLILWRAVSARQLALAGGALLATAVPLLYLLVPVDDKGGFNTNLAVERIAAHWAGVAAVTLLGAALWRSLAAARAAHPARPRLPGRRRGVRRPAP